MFLKKGLNPVNVLFDNFKRNWMLDSGNSLYSWQPIYSAFHSFIPSFNCVFKYIQTQARAPNVLHPILLSPRGIMGCYAGGISWAVNLNRFLQPFWLENCKVRETFTDKWLIQYRDLVFRLCNVTKCTCWPMAKFNVKDNITALKQLFFSLIVQTLLYLRQTKGVFLQLKCSCLIFAFSSSSFGISQILHCTLCHPWSKGSAPFGNLNG